MIDIKTYAVPKEGTTNKYYSTSNNSNAEPVNPFEPHYLWGQYFDDTQDIDGDMQVNGIVNADKLRSIYLETTNADIENADIENADINNASIVNLDADYGEIDNLSGINLNYSLATIISAYIKELSSDEITTENLTVTKSAHFFELVIDKIKAAGGALILTPADGFRIDIVQDVSDGKKLLFKATDGERAIRNMWQVNDQAICQTFNQAQVGTNYNVSNKYWWSLVTAVGTETINEEDYHYIVVSSTTKDGTLNPEEGDEVAMLGYRGNDDPNRQSAIYISAYTSLDDELVAPLICQYRGINDFNLASHKYTWFAAGVTAKGQSNGISANSIRGHLLLSSGLSVEDAINGQVVDITTYRILLNTTTIKVSDSSITPSTISATFLKNHNGDVQELSTVPVSLSVKLYGVVGSTEQILNTWNAGGTVTKQTTGLDIYDYLYFTLSDNSKTYDITSISIVADGQDGQDGQDGSSATNGGYWAFAYKSSKTQPAKPTGTGNTNGWSSTPTTPDYANGYYLWMSQCFVSGTGTYGEWTTPIRFTGDNGQAGEDGTKVEFIYAVNTSTTTPPAITYTAYNNKTRDDDDFVPAGWTDNPTGVQAQNEVEWVSTRVKEHGVWSDFSTPALWSKWGDKGTDGDGYEYIYKAQATQPSNPNNITTPASDSIGQTKYDDDFVPNGWSDEPVQLTSSTLYVWVSTRKKNSGSWGQFSAPKIWAHWSSAGSNGNTWAFIYNNSKTKPTKPNDGVSVGSLPAGWSTTITEPDYANGYYTWMSCNEVVGGTTYGAWSDPIRITGQDGKAGEDGTKIEFIYKLTSSSTTPSTPSTSQTDDYVPSSWTDNPTGVDETNQYEWVSTREKVNGTWSAFSTPALWSKWGEKGMDGDGYEYIYKHFTTEQTFENNNANPAYWNANQNDEYYGPSNYVWSDDPVGVNSEYQYEYVSVRKKEAGTWSKFSTPALWSRYASQGANGGHYIFMYKNSSSKPAKPANGTNSSQMTANGWSTNPSSPDFTHDEYTWMTQCFLLDNQYGEWTDPIRITGENGQSGEDGTKVEFIYKRTTSSTAPSKPSTSQTDDYVPSGWTDNPSGVSETNQYEWVCTREKENGTWSQFSTPALWSKWGEKGMDGDGYEYIYKKFTTEQTWLSNNNNPAYWAASQNDEYYGPSNYQWSDDPVGVDSQYQYEYVSVRKKEAGTWSKFSTPALWSRYASQGANGGHYIFMYKNSSSKPAKPANGTNSSQMTANGWSTNPSSPDFTHDEYTWMTQCFLLDNQYGEWTDPIRITGENGQSGEDGTKVEFIYKRTTSSTAPSKPSTSQTDDYVPSGWTDNPTGVDETNQYEWVSTRDKENDTWSAFSTPALWSKWGEKGMDGDGYEYIYKATNTMTSPMNPANITQPSSTSNGQTKDDDDFVPNGWSDEPVQLSNSALYEWVSIRKKSNGAWQPFSTPKLWAQWSAPGSNGQDGNTWVFIYNNSKTKPTKPNDHVGIGSLPSGWSTTITEPNYSQGYYTWMSQTEIVGNVYGVWSDPIKITGLDGKAGEDGTKIEFIYKLTTQNSVPSTPSTSQTDDYVPSTWTDNPTGVDETNQYEWVSTRDKENGTWSAFSTPALWSKWGEKGMDGDGYEYIYKHFTTEQTFGSNNANPAYWTANQSDEYLGPSRFQWYDDPQGISSQYKYEYVAVRKKRDGEWGQYTTPKLWGKWTEGGTGQDGQDGQDGENAKQDLMLDCGSYCTITYNSSNKKYILSRRFAIAVFHHDGNTRIQVTDNTTPSRSDYAIYWKYNTRSGNMFEDDGINVSSDGVWYTDYDEDVQYNTLSSIPQFATYQLRTANGQAVLDQIIVYVKMAPAAVFEVTQDQIQSYVSGVMETVNGQITSIQNSISTLTQNYNSITATVRGITSTINGITGDLQQLEEDFSQISLDLNGFKTTVYKKTEVDGLISETQSMIQQTADNITLMVTNGLSQTGIDITNGTITLSASNTVVNGNLILQQINDVSQGFIFRNSNGEDGLKLTTDAVPALQNFIDQYPGYTRMLVGTNGFAWQSGNSNSTDRYLYVTSNDITLYSDSHYGKNNEGMSQIRIPLSGGQTGEIIDYIGDMNQSQVKTWYADSNSTTNVSFVESNVKVQHNGVRCVRLPSNATSAYYTFRPSSKDKVLLCYPTNGHRIRIDVGATGVIGNGSNIGHTYYIKIMSRASSNVKVELFGATFLPGDRDLENTLSTTFNITDNCIYTVIVLGNCEAGTTQYALVGRMQSGSYT